VGLTPVRGHVFVAPHVSITPIRIHLQRRGHRVDELEEYIRKVRDEGVDIESIDLQNFPSALVGFSEMMQCARLYSYLSRQHLEIYVEFWGVLYEDLEFARLRLPERLPEGEGEKFQDLERYLYRNMEIMESDSFFVRAAGQYYVHHQ
jgi:hypothetical protein